MCKGIRQQQLEEETMAIDEEEKETKAKETKVKVSVVR